MKYRKLEYYLSPARFSRYLRACNQDSNRAKDLYRANLRLAQAFYPLLHLTEVFLRNAINENLVNHFHDINWITNEKTGFMNDPSLKRSSYWLKNKVNWAESNVRRNGGYVTNGKIIAELSFGFWTALFKTHHYRLLQGSLIHCFSNKPNNANRATIYHHLDKIRIFRNRVYHNEPICFIGYTKNLTSTMQVKRSIYNITRWMDKDLESYISYYDNVDGKIRQTLKV